MTKLNGNDAMSQRVFVRWSYRCVNVAKLSTIIPFSFCTSIYWFWETIPMRISILAWCSSLHLIGVMLLYSAVFIRQYLLANHKIFIDLMKTIWKSSHSSIVYKVYFERMLDEGQRKRNNHKVRKATPYCILGGVLEWIHFDAAFNSSMQDFQNQTPVYMMDACV